MVKHFSKSRAVPGPESERGRSGSHLVRTSEPYPPLAIVSEIGNRRTVVAMCAAASASHVRTGMSLTEARVMCPGLMHSPYEPGRDAVALTALARWLAMRFTPIVAVEPPDALFLEIGGCERLFGGIEAIVERVRAAVRRFGFAASLAVAGTPGAAWAFAKYAAIKSQAGMPVPPKTKATQTKIDMRIAKGECGLLKSPRYLKANSGSVSSWEPAGVRAGESEISNSRSQIPNTQCPNALTLTLSQEERGPDSSLADLPPAALRISPEIAQTLSHLGVVTIRQLAGLPRDALPSRFGKELLLRLDQATGRVPEPLVAVECRTPIVASREWDGPVDAQESLAWVLDELIVEAIAKLERRGEGARRIEVTFRCPYAPSITKEIALSRASRELKNLKRLTRCMLEAIESSEGFISIKLRVSTAEPIVAARQASLVDGERENAQDEIENLVERLTIRLGDAAIQRAMLVESHLPERAVKYSDTPTATRSDLSTRRKSDQNESDHTMVGVISARPLTLLTHPIGIGVMVSPSDDCEGFPIFFTHASSVHRLNTVVGPERVASVWWTGHNKSRDYFDVTDDDGKRFWIFRVIETRKWFLHGVF